MEASLEAARVSAMGRFLLVAALLATTACKDKKSEGLPPAQEWSASTNTLPAAPQPGGNNPHAQANPHMGGMGGADPHAGVDMNNPHGGGSPDVAKMGLPPPDPNRKLDPTHRVSGTIKIHPKAKDKAKMGTAVFVIIKAAGPDGQPAGPPLAVDKLTWQKDELKFEMTDAQSMIAGTELKGDVIVTVRYDGDGDALSKLPGDIVGTAHVKVPADNVNIVLDDVLQ